MARRKGRILAFQALYSYDMGNVNEENVIEFSWVDQAVLDRMGEAGQLFARLIVIGTIDNLQEVDQNIKDHLANWSFDRLNKVDLAILRMSTYSLLFQKDIHPSIVIDEAVDIAKEYGSDDAYKFINAVLDSIRKDL